MPPICTGSAGRHCTKKKSPIVVLVLPMFCLVRNLKIGLPLYIRYHTFRLSFYKDSVPQVELESAWTLHRLRKRPCSITNSILLCSDIFLMFCLQRKLENREIFGHLIRIASLWVVYFHTEGLVFLILHKINEETMIYHPLRWLSSDVFCTLFLRKKLEDRAIFFT